jgi:cell division protein ZapA
VSDEARTVTRVDIAGDEYTIRSEASEEYTRECARYVNETIDQIMSQGRLVEAHKAAILAAMALADQLFQAREEAETVRAELTERSARLLAEIERKAAASDLASGE